MKKAVIFDLDGTLLNTLPSIAYFGNKALQENGLPSIEEETYKYLVGEGAPLLVRRMLEHVGVHEDADRDAFQTKYEAVYQVYRRDYDANTAYKTTYYDGILDLLGSLKHHLLHLAVFSNKPQAQVDHVLKAFFPEDLFDQVLGAQEGLPRKPDPTGVFQICDALGVRTDECLYMGDTATDMQTGTAAGCLTIGVSWGFRTIEELLNNGAYAVAEKPNEILQLI